MTKQGHELVIPLVNKVDGCSETSTEVRLLTAENYKIRFDGKQWMDLDKERQAVLDRLDRVVEENRKKREIKAAEQKEIQAMNEKYLRADCLGIYKKTAHKKVSDLTVLEEENVRACQAIDWYPPR